MSITIERDIDADTWDDFITRTENANIFHNRNFLEIFRGSKRYTPHTFFMLEDGHVRASIIAVQTKVLGSFLSGLTSRSVIYGGVTFDHRAGQRYWYRHLGDLLSSYDNAVSGSTLYSEVRNMSDPADIIIPMAKQKYTLSPHLNYLIDLRQGEERLWSNLSQSLRKAIRKAEKKNLEIRECSTEKEIEIFHEMVSGTYAKVHVPCLELDIFKKAWKILSPPGMLRMTLARQNGKTIASRAALVYKGRVFDWFAGSSPEGDLLNANTVLAWDMIRWGSTHGLELFDFGGAGDPNKPYGVRDFKMRFMGTLVNYGRFTRIYSKPGFALSTISYNLLRRFLY